MKCGYCGEPYDDATPHYCAAGRNFLVAENARLRASIEDYREQLVVRDSDDAAENIRLRAALGRCREAFIVLRNQSGNLQFETLSDEIEEALK